jgi:hypothetical protein
MKHAVSAVHRTQALMGPADPVPAEAFASDWANDHWQAEYRRILAGPPGYAATPPAAPFRIPARTSSRRARGLGAAVLPLLAGVVCAVLVAAMPADGPRGRLSPGAAGTAWPTMLRYKLTGVRSPVTATNLPSARDILLHLAGVAGAQPPIPKPAGADVSYTSVRAWDGAGLDITTHGPVNAYARPGSEQTWTAPDGTVLFADCGANLACDPSDDQTISPGQRIGTGAGPLAGSLSADPATLRGQLLAQGVDRYPEAPSQELIRTIAYGICAQAVAPRLQANLWRVLAGQPDIWYMGTVTDRDGRPGVAVEYLGSFWMNDDYRYVLIISPATGRLIGEEEIQLPIHQDANGGLARGGGSPVVAEYRIYLGQGWTTRLGNPMS